MTLPMFLILSNFNADLASVARVSVVRVLAAEESKGMAEISVFKGSLSVSCALSPFNFFKNYVHYAPQNQIHLLWGYHHPFAVKGTNFSSDEKSFTWIRDVTFFLPWVPEPKNNNKKK